jgi:hypothetical protein
MTKTKIHVWYDADGNIKAVGRPSPSMQQRITPIKTDDTQGVMVAELAEELLSTVHRTHRIDVKAERLVPRSGESPAEH